MSWSYGNFDPVVNGTTMVPDGISSDAWDYFAISTAGQSTSDDFDWLMDNFKVEVIGSNAPFDVADFNHDTFVSAADLAVLRTNFGTGTTNAQGDANGDGHVDGQDFLVWQQHSNAATPATGSAT